MDMALTELCINKQPVDRKRIELIKQASPVVLDECLGLPDCQGWFLDEAFRHRYDTDLERTQRIVSHVNCLPKLIALMDTIQPEMVADVPAMRAIQLDMMMPEGQKEWQRLKHFTREPNLDRFVEYYLYGRDKDLIREAVDGVELDHYQLRAELLRVTPRFIIEYCLQHAESQDYIATYMAIDELEHFIERLSPKYAAVALQREEIPREWFERFASHKSVTLRKAVANDPRTSQEALCKLAADKHAGIKEIALNRLPEDMRNSVLGESLLSSSDASTTTSDDGHFFTVLRLAQAGSSQLAKVAAEADDLLACAATLHPCADEQVLDALCQRTGLPQWACIGLAMKTERAEEIDTLIDDGNRHLCIGLSSNPHLTLDQASALMRKLPDDRVLANLANTFIDQPEAITALSSLAVAKSPLAAALKRLLKDSTDEKKLSSLHGSRNCRPLVVQRLVARHPNCPKKLYPLYASYLPDDLARNTRYSLAVLESAKPIKPKAIDKWKIDDYLDQGHAPEFLCDWLLRNDEIGRQRKVIACTHANPNAIRHLTVLDDSHVHRRFVHERTMTYSEYEYRMLARIGSPSVRKALAEKGYANNAILQELALDRDKSVAMAAQRLAKKRGVRLAGANRVDSTSSKGLGNKAARLELATESKDPAILSLLVTDKLKDVRSTVAARRELAPALSFELLKDPEEQVLLSALYGIRDRVFNAEEKPILQELLCALVSDTSKGADVRKRAMRSLPDPSAGDPWYGRENGLFDSEIFAITADTGIIDDLLFRLERGEVTRNWESVFDNPHLTISQCEALLSKCKRRRGWRLGMLIRKHPDLDVVVALLEKHIALSEEEGFSQRKQDCSPEQILALASNPNIPSRALISVWGRHMWKLPEPKFTELFEWALEQGGAYDMAVDPNNTEKRRAYIIQRLLEKNHEDLLEYFCYRVKLTERQIDGFLDNDSSAIRRGIAEGQELTDAQIRRLENDVSLGVRVSLFDSRGTPRSRLSSEFLRAYGKVYRDHRSAVEEELRLRGEEVA
ncbi:hypothetical protein [Microbulbifer aggregans]|uniref:hypothetical protein n=1 Tax=Microbulbifer aggregans TaxID=1769779 RepID=UPI001CFE79F3|nr:hypothetical protein [Microbulbifer aggregans]